MSEFNVSCPHCGQAYRMTEEKLAASGGRTVKCKNCQQTFALPPADPAENAGPTSPAPPPLQPPPASQWQAPSAQQQPVQQQPAPPPQMQYPTPPAGGYGGGPAAQLDYATPPPSHMSFGSILSFRAMVTPMVIQVIFWIVTALVVIGGLTMIASAFAFRNVNFVLFFSGLGYIFLGPIFVRIYCELLIVIFRIYETLQEIRDSLRRR